jgi:hypothetical protein
LPVLGLVVVVVGVLVVLGVRNQPEWRVVFDEDFDSPVATGEFPGSEYRERWTSYQGFADTSGNGWYDPGSVLSVHDGVLDMHLFTDDDGVPLGAAPVPLVDGQWGGQLYGRYEIRFSTDSIPGFGAGWLLWPDSNDWSEGEIDFPEGGLDSTIYANQHCIGDPEQKCLHVDTGVEFSSGWHTTMIEWRPSGVTYYLDGEEVAHSPESPSTLFHLVLQVGTNDQVPPATSEGHVLIDRVTIAVLA